MATKPIKKYFKDASDAYDKTMATSHKVKVKGKGVGRQYKTDEVRKWREKEDDAVRLHRKKPKGMSDAEWARQIKSGEAMVQGALKSKRSKSSWATHGLKKVKPSGPKKPKEFIITTVREPELMKKAAKARARRKK